MCVCASVFCICFFIFEQVTIRYSSTFACDSRFFFMLPFDVNSNFNELDFIEPCESFNSFVLFYSIFTSLLHHHTSLGSNQQVFFVSILSTRNRTKRIEDN